MAACNAFTSPLDPAIPVDETIFPAPACLATCYDVNRLFENIPLVRRRLIMRALTTEEGSIHQRKGWLRDVAGVMIRRHLAVRAAELNVADPVLIRTVEEQLA